MKKKVEYFTRFGWVFIVTSLVYGWYLRKKHGGSIPNSTEEWMGEFVAIFLSVAGAGFVAVGRQIKNNMQ